MSNPENNHDNAPGGVDTTPVWVKRYRYHGAVAKNLLQDSENMRKDENGEYLVGTHLSALDTELLSTYALLASTHINMQRELREFNNSATN